MISMSFLRSCSMFMPHLRERVASWADDRWGFRNSKVFGGLYDKRNHACLDNK